MGFSKVLGPGLTASIEVNGVIPIDLMGDELGQSKGSSKS